MAVTIKDVAKLAGVSPSTVSRVCNNNPTISRETRERVQKAIQELGYELTISQDNQSSFVSKNIGVILPPSALDAYENTFYLKAIRGISQICNQCHANTCIVTGQDYEEVLQSVQNLHRSDRVDGFIVLYSRKNDIIIDYLCEHGLLYVIVGKPSDLPSQTICVDNDNLLASREATDYLYSLGHRRIAFIGGKTEYMHASDRRDGYHLSMMLHGLPAVTAYHLEMEDVRSHEYQDLIRLLQSPERPTAFVVSDDMLALALERMCTQLGLSIPEDISIIAFNNSLYAQLASPQLTAVDINSYSLGREAANQILNHSENPNLPATTTIIPHAIVERKSCARIYE